jgi:hypothetical protein
VHIGLLLAHAPPDSTWRNRQVTRYRDLPGQVMITDRVQEQVLRGTNEVTDSGVIHRLLTRIFA